jgi:hypothetical protein
MNERLLQLIQEADLSARTRLLLLLLDTADPCFVGLVVGLLLLLGIKMASGQRHLQRWGLLLAGALFVVHLGYSCFQADWPGGEALGILALRSAIAAGGALAGLWIVCPVLSFAYRYLRLAVAGFLIYGGYALCTAEQIDLDHLRLIGVRSLGVSALTMVVAWILQPVWEVLRRFLPTPSPRAEPVPPREVKAEPAREPPAPQPSASRGTPASPPTPLAAPPQPAAIQAPMFQAHTVRMTSESVPSSAEVNRSSTGEPRRRRDRVRLQVEMVYVLVQPQVGSAFPRSLFEEFLNRYLGDHLPPEEVEENGRQLLMLLENQQRGEAHNEGPRTLEELTRWFLEEQKRLQERPLDPFQKRRQLNDLQQQYTTRAQRMLG